MEQYYANIKVTGGKEEIDEFLQLLCKIQVLGSVGANRTIPVAVDGDGSARLRFETTDTDENLIDRLRDAVNNGRTINMDDKPFLEQLDKGTELETHFIGE